MEEHKYKMRALLNGYGVMSAIAFYFGSSFSSRSAWLILIFVAVIQVIAKIMYKKEYRGYSFASWINASPVLLLLPCDIINEYVRGASLASAIGRIGCVMSSCCAGKPCKHNEIFYTTNRAGDKTYPTIMLEVLLQFGLTTAVFNTHYSVLLFGILNALYIYLRSLWRDKYYDTQPGYLKSTIINSILFGLLGHIKCKGTGMNFQPFKYDPQKALLSTIMSFIISGQLFQL